MFKRVKKKNYSCPPANKNKTHFVGIATLDSSTEIKKGNTLFLSFISRFSDVKFALLLNNTPQVQQTERTSANHAIC